MSFELRTGQVTSSGQLNLNRPITCRLPSQALRANNSGSLHLSCLCGCWDVRQMWNRLFFLSCCYFLVVASLSTILHALMEKLKTSNYTSLPRPPQCFLCKVLYFLSKIIYAVESVYFPIFDHQSTFVFSKIKEHIKRRFPFCACFSITFLKWEPYWKKNNWWWCQPSIPSFCYFSGWGEIFFRKKWKCFFFHPCSNTCTYLLEMEWSEPSPIDLEIKVLASSFRNNPGNTDQFHVSLRKWRTAMYPLSKRTPWPINKIIYIFSNKG